MGQAAILRTRRRAFRTSEITDCNLKHEPEPWWSQIATTFIEAIGLLMPPPEESKEPFGFRHPFFIVACRPTTDFLP